MDDQEQQQNSTPTPIITSPIILGDIRLGSPSTQLTVGSAGSASALPATPSGYLIIQVGDSPKVLPYYDLS